MNSDGRSTSQQLYIPTLLIIDGCEDLVDRCYEAADESGLSLKTCTLREAAEAIPRRHPLAIVVPNWVFDDASHDLEALARDVRSVLFRVDPDVSARELQAMFAAAIAGSTAQRERRSGAGRYSITDTLAEEAPFSRSTPPPSSRAPLSSRAPMSARQTLPRVSVESVPPAAAGETRPPPPRAPGLASTRPAAPSAPPNSGTQPIERPSYAAIRAVFSGR